MADGPHHAASFFAPPSGDGDGAALPATADLFLELADLDPAAQTARLATLTDSALRAEVAALLAADAEAGTVLSRLDRLAPPAVPTPSRVGERVGAYRLTEEIGRGGMGVVYRAEDIRLGRPVALKVLAPALSSDPEARARLLAEARAAAALDHPNVCAVHAVEEAADGGLVLVMPCYEGETLKRRLAAGPLPPGEARRIAAGLAAGLAAAHGRGIVHRDVKPSNVLLTTDGTPKLLDFGIARSAESDLTKTGAALGTAAYMAPEQTRGERVDARADVWALGVVLYEMLAGRRPFAGPEAAAVHAIRHDDPAPLPEGTPPVLARVVAKALSKRPEDRHADAGALLAELDGAPTPPRRLRRWPIFAGLAAVALGAVAVFFALRGRETPPADDTFVIAVAPFAAVGEGAGEEAGVMQALVLRELDAVLEAEDSVRVVALDGAAPQTRLAAEGMGEAAGAHLVVWGDVVALGTEVEFQPSLVRAVPYPGAALEASELAGAAAFRTDLTEGNQLALRRTAAAGVGDLALLIAARAAAERDQPDRALALLGRLRTPSAESERVTGLAYTLKGDLAAGEAHLRNALALDSARVTTWMWLGYLLMNDSRPVEAEAVARHAVARFPDESDLHSMLGWALSWQGRVEEAAEVSRRAVALAPGSATAQSRLGWAYYMSGRLEEAAQAFDAAAAQGERILAVDSYEGLAETRYAQGRFAEAEAAARAALRLRPRHPLEHDMLARTLAAQGRLDEAERSWATAAARATSPYAAVFYPLLVAYTRARLGRPDDVAPLRPLADTLSADHPLSPLYRFAFGRATEAEVLAQAARMDPRYGQNWLFEAHWALAHFYEAGVGAVPADTARALAHYREAAARDYAPAGALTLPRFALQDLERKAGAAR